MKISRGITFNQIKIGTLQTGFQGIDTGETFNIPVPRSGFGEQFGILTYSAITNTLMHVSDFYGKGNVTDNYIRITQVNPDRSTTQLAEVYVYTPSYDNLRFLYTFSTTSTDAYLSHSNESNNYITSRVYPSGELFKPSSNARIHKLYATNGDEFTIDGQNNIVQKNNVTIYGGNVSYAVFNQEAQVITVYGHPNITNIDFDGNVLSQINILDEAVGMNPEMCTTTSEALIQDGENIHKLGFDGTFTKNFTTRTALGGIGFTLKGSYYYNGKLYAKKSGAATVGIYK